ncbi:MULTISPECIES: PIN domain-containing protein [Sorangium]|nr:MULTISPECIES: PIN domain-containing protein [Sorangium]
MTAAAPAGATALPLVMFDTNVIFDFFLGRDPEILLLAQLSRQHVEIRIPEFVLMEFRGSILRELGGKEKALSSVRQLANELERADHWMSGVDRLRAGCELVMEDIARLRGKLDTFLDVVRKQFDVEPHSPDIHYKGDLRYVQGLPPDEPKRGVQDCRIFEAALAIGRADATNNRPARFFLTKDSDFLKKVGVKDELDALGIELVGSAGQIYGRFAPR